MVGLEETFKDQAQPPCYELGHLSLDQVVQSPIRFDLEHLQGWGIYSFSGQPVPAPHHTHYKNFLLDVQSEPILFSLKLFTLVLSLQAVC